jgi:hypothetical protein
MPKPTDADDDSSTAHHAHSASGRGFALGGAPGVGDRTHRRRRCRLVVVPTPRPRTCRRPGCGRERKARHGRRRDLPVGPNRPRQNLSDAIYSFATGLQDIAMNALAGVGNEDPAQTARLRDAEATNARIAELCK